MVWHHGAYDKAVLFHMHCTVLYRLRHSTLDARLSQPRNNKRRTLLLRSPANREELGDKGIMSVCLLDQINRHSPPSAQRGEHPEVRGCFHAHGNAANFAVAGARGLGCAAVVGKHAAGDGTADCE